jgi:hydrogenase expression/formation protein HypC
MCLAIPARVIELLPDEMARVTLDGVVVKASVALVDDVAIGDYVVLHVGYALAKIDEDEALRTLALLREAALLGADA